MIFWGWLLCHINHFRLSNAKSSLYKYIKCICFGLVGFYCTTTIEGYSFQTIKFCISTQFQSKKQFNSKLFSLVNKVKWFQVFLCMANSIKHQSFSLVK